MGVAAALGREGVSPSSHDTRREMTQLLKPQQVQQNHGAEYCLYFSYFVQGMKEEQYPNMSTYILRGSQSLICEQRSH